MKSPLMPPASRIPTCIGTLAVHDTGHISAQSQTIVLWSSILADFRIYRHQIEAWREMHRLITIDGPGHGESGPASGPFLMHDCGQALGEVLDALAIGGEVVVVGTSWGGLVAGEFALAQPRRTRALVMLNTPIIKTHNRPTLSDRFIVWGARWIHSTKIYRDGVAKSFFKRSTIRREGLTQQDFHKHLSEVNGLWLSQAVRSVLIDREPLAPRMKDIKPPTLFVAGRHDAMYPAGALRVAAQELSHGRFVELDTAHISVVDEPEQVTELINDFLRGLPHSPEAQTI
jgi:3-oxoadipate enol-lactonase